MLGWGCSGGFLGMANRLGSGIKIRRFTAVDEVC